MYICRIMSHMTVGISFISDNTCCLEVLFDIISHLSFLMICVCMVVSLFHSLLLIFLCCFAGGDHDCLKVFCLAGQSLPGLLARMSDFWCCYYCCCSCCLICTHWCFWLRELQDWNVKAKRKLRELMSVLFLDPEVPNLSAFSLPLSLF